MALCFRRLLAIAPLSLLLASGSALAEDWVVDSSHSQVGFKVRHMMVSWVRGTFNDFEGKVVTDGAALKSISGKVKVLSVDTDEQKRDEHLASPDFFDATKIPEMGFTSTQVVKDGSGWKVTGDLTIRGVTKPVTFAVDALPDARTDPWGNIKTGTSMTTKINRQDFGLTWNKTLDGGGWVVGDEVEISIDLELNKAK